MSTNNFSTVYAVPYVSDADFLDLLSFLASEQITFERGNPRVNFEHSRATAWIATEGTVGATMSVYLIQHISNSKPAQEAIVKYVESRQGEQVSQTLLMNNPGPDYAKQRQYIFVHLQRVIREIGSTHRDPVITTECDTIESISSLAGDYYPNCKWEMASGETYICISANRKLCKQANDANDYSAAAFYRLFKVTTDGYATEVAISSTVGVCKCSHIISVACGDGYFEIEAHKIPNIATRKNENDEFGEGETAPLTMF